MGRRRGYAITDVRRPVVKSAVEAAYASTGCKRADAETVVAVDYVCTVCESTTAPYANKSIVSLTFESNFD
jgi:hypothetical protein